MLDSRYPTLVRRYASTAIDGLLIIGAMVVVAQLFGENDRWAVLRAVMFFVILFGYEPICTCYACTLGQRLTGIRVRRATDATAHISLGAAFVRYLTKIPLGSISLLMVAFSNRRRAIHDFAAGSVMLQLVEPASAPGAV